VIVRGKLMAVNADPSRYDLTRAQTIQLADDEYVLPRPRGPARSLQRDPRPQSQARCPVVSDAALV
jgi:hypothetical protein